MAVTRKTTVETLKLTVSVTAIDIREGQCRIASKCMEKIAIQRGMNELPGEGGKDHKVRVDAGAVMMTYRGFRWRDSLPPKAKRAMIAFDQEEKAKLRADKKGEDFVSSVKPHSYVLKFIKERAVKKLDKRDRERLDQINAARAQRESEGRDDYSKFRKRVIGLSTV